jgi:hypothetical protein
MLPFDGDALESLVLIYILSVCLSLSHPVAVMKHVFGFWSMLAAHSQASELSHDSKMEGLHRTNTGLYVCQTIYLRAIK